MEKAMKDLLVQVRKELQSFSGDELKAAPQYFFKEETKQYGIRNEAVRKIAKEALKQLKMVPKEDIYNLCNDLWKSGYLEEALIASEWAYAQRKKYKPEDFEVFEQWIGQYVNNWASCDDFCNKTVGAFLLMYPDYLPKLKLWAVDKNRWVQRAAAVSLIVPARQGKFSAEIIAIAKLELKSSDDLVQKGYGWLLKELSKTNEALVFDFVMAHKEMMPRTALRYAIEKMPDQLKKQAMQL